VLHKTEGKTTTNRAITGRLCFSLDQSDKLTHKKGHYTKTSIAASLQIYAYGLK